MSRLSVALLALVAVSSCKCSAGAPASFNGSPVGTYSIDKVAMERSIDAKMPTMTPEQQEMARFNKTMRRTMDLKLTLREDGKGEMDTTLPSMQPGTKGPQKTDALTWEKRGEGVFFTDGKKQFTCEVKPDRLVCNDGKQEYVFLRH